MSPAPDFHPADSLIEKLETYMDEIVANEAHVFAAIATVLCKMIVKNGRDLDHAMGFVDVVSEATKLGVPVLWAAMREKG